MNTDTGFIIDHEKLKEMPADERSKYIEVKRDLTARERSDRQIQLYSPCACGSGKNFKFCCYTGK